MESIVNNGNIGIIKTPCVGVCSTGIGDDVCRGCKRYSHEVINWNAYKNDQKAVIEKRLVSLLTKIIKNKISIVDESVLKWQIEVQQISVSKHRNLYCQAYELIKVGPSLIKNIESFGLKVINVEKKLSLKEICEQIDQEFYVLSVAHYERYFQKFA